MFRIQPVKPIAVLFFLLAVTTTSSTGAFAQRKDHSEANPGMIVTYNRSGQVATVITVSGSELARSVTACHNSAMAQTCQDPTTESVTVKLSSDDVQKLKSLIRTSGFLQLQDTYGTRNFSYPKTITVKTEGMTKSVEYRGGSDASPEPDAFVSVETMLETLASRVSRTRSTR